MEKKNKEKETRMYCSEAWQMWRTCVELNVLSQLIYTIERRDRPGHSFIRSFQKCVYCLFPPSFLYPHTLLHFSVFCVFRFTLSHRAKVNFHICSRNDSSWHISLPWQPYHLKKNLFLRPQLGGQIIWEDEASFSRDDCCSNNRSRRRSSSSTANHR